MKNKNPEFVLKEKKILIQNLEKALKLRRKKYYEKSIEKFERVIESASKLKDFYAKSNQMIKVAKMNQLYNYQNLELENLKNPDTFDKEKSIEINRKIKELAMGKISSGNLYLNELIKNNQ